MKSNMTNTQALDRDFCAVMCRHDGEAYFAEMQVGRATEEQVVNDIATGQYENVLAVFKFNPVEGTCRDVSEDVARAVLGIQLDELGGDINDSCSIDFLEEHLGCRAVVEACREHLT